MDEQKLLAFVRGCDVDFRTDNGTLDRWYTSSGREFVRKLADMPLYDADNSSNSLLHQHLVVTLRPEAVSMFISEALGELLDVDGNAAPRNGKGVATALAQIVRRERDDRYPDGVNPAKILFIFKIMERMAVNTNPEIFSRPEEPINGHNAVIEISKAAIPSWNPVEYRMFPNVANELAAYVLASIHGKTVGNTKKLAEQHLQEAASQQKDEDMRIWGSDVMLPLGVRGTAPALLAIHREALQARFDDDRGLSIHQTRVLTALQGLPPQAIYESLGMLLQAPTEAVPPHVLLKKYSSGVYGFTFHPESSPIRAILALGHLKTPEAVGKLAMGIRTLYVPLLNGGQFEKMPACARLSLPTIQQSLISACDKCGLPAIEIAKALLPRKARGECLDAGRLRPEEFEMIAPFVLANFSEVSRALNDDVIGLMEGFGDSIVEAADTIFLRLHKEAGNGFDPEELEGCDDEERDARQKAAARSRVARVAVRLSELTRAQPEALKRAGLSAGHPEKDPRVLLELPGNIKAALDRKALKAGAKVMLKLPRGGSGTGGRMLQ